MITLDDIKEKILSEINNIRNTTYQHSQKYLICKNFLENNKLTKAEHFKDIDVWEFVKCLYILKSKSNKSIEEIEEIFNNFKLCFMNLDYLITHLLFIFIFKIPGSKEEQEIYNFINEPNKVKALILLSNLYKTYDLNDLISEDFETHNIESYLKILRKIQQNGDDIFLVINLFRNESQLMVDICTLITSYKAINEEYLNIKADIFFTKDEFAAYNTILNFINNENKKEKEYEKNKDFTINYYYKLIDRLTKASKEEEITNATDLVRLIKNEKLKINVLKYIYFHNKAYYEKLQKDVQRLDYSGLLNYQQLLKKYKIEISFNEVTFINHNSLDDIESILNLLPRIFTSQELIQILKYTNLDLIQKIKKYYDLRFLDDNFLQNNLEIFNSDSDLLSRFEFGLSILNEKGINPQLFQNNPCILIKSPTLLEQNLNILIDYNLIVSIKTTDNYCFLLEKDLITKIDYLIELGLYNFLGQDLDILNIPYSLLKRIELLNALGEMINSIEELWSIIDLEEFIVPDELIDGYLPNVASLMPKENLTIKSLDKIKTNNISIRLGQTIISIPKVKRMLTKGLSLQNALFYNKKVNLDTYQNIISDLKNNEKVL